MGCSGDWGGAAGDGGGAAAAADVYVDKKRAVAFATNFVDTAIFNTSQVLLRL
jgi:hypothetical protein